MSMPPSDPSATPPKRGLGKAVIALVVAVVVLVVLLGGMWFVQRDGEQQADSTASPTSETASDQPSTATSFSSTSTNSVTEEPRTSSTAASPSSSSGSATGLQISFPDEFGVWTKVKDTHVSGRPAAMYANGDLRLAVSFSSAPVSALAEGMTDPREIKEAVCGEGPTKQIVCVRDKDGTSYVISVAGTRQEIAGYLNVLLKEL